MASDERLQVIISAVDRATEVFKRINSNIEGIVALLRRVHARLNELGEASGLKRVGERARHALEQVKHLAEGLLELAGPLAALGGLASLGGLVEMAKSTGEFYERLKLGSVATGIAAGQLSGWHYAAKLANIDAEQLDKGFQRLNRNIALGAMGKAKDAETIFAKMGFHNAPGHLVATSDALRGVAAETKHLVDSGNTQLASAMLGQLFGARAGMALLPLFAKGPAELAKIMEEAKKHGLMPDDAEVQKGYAFAESLKQMEGAAEGLKLSIGGALFPVLTPVIEEMTRWVDANREWLATKIGDAVRQFGTWVKSINWDHVIAGTEHLIGIAGSLIDRFGSVQTVLLAIAAVEFGPLILAFTQVGLAAARAGITIGLAFVSNPVGAIITAVGLLGYELWDLYENWDTVWPMMKADVAAFGTMMEALGGTIVRVSKRLWTEWSADMQHAIDGYKAAFTALEGFFKGLWDNIAGVFKSAWEDHLKPIFDAMKDAVDWIGNHVPGLSSPGGAAGAGGSDSGPGTFDPNSGMFFPSNNPHVASAAEAISQKGPVLQTILDALKARGASDAVAQGLVAAALGEGGVAETWKKGDQGTSFGPWQLHAGGRLDPYLALGNRAGDVAAQASYVLDTMISKIPNFLSETDPRQVVGQMHDTFKDYGASAGNLASAAGLIRAQRETQQGAASSAKVQLHVTTDPQLVTGLRGVETKGAPDLEMNLGRAFGEYSFAH